MKERIRKVIELKNKEGGEDLPLWLGETADANLRGMHGKTDIFLSTFLWLDKLGVAAESGVTLVARQVHVFLTEMLPRSARKT